MLRKPLLALSCLLCIFDLAAQQPFKSSTYLGINAGGCFSRVSFNPFIKQNMLTGTSVGMLIRHISEPHIGVQVEVNVARHGWIENRDSLGSYRRDMRVLDIPVSAVFVAGTKSLRFVFSLGPDVTYLMHQSEQINIVDAHFVPDFYRFVHDNKVYPTSYGNPFYRGYYTKPLTQLWSLGFTGGLAVEWYSPVGTFGLRASYNYFLTDIFPYNSDIFYYNTSKPQIINVGVTYFIKLF
jgi:hypothetical protein